MIKINIIIENLKEAIRGEYAAKRKYALFSEKALKEKIDEGENSRANWRKYFVNKRKELIKFLETAIKLNEPIDCSL